MVLLAFVLTAMIAAIGGAFIGAWATDQKRRRRGERHVRVIGLRSDDR